MSIQFATPGQRCHTGNIRWDLQGPLPFGIADMDIATPECIREALQQRLDHPFYGYAYMTDAVRQAITSYLATRHGVHAEPAWLHELPGCVPAFTLVIRALCSAREDAVLVGTPAYPPMLHAHEDAGCTLITFPHHEVNGRWEMDWDAMEAAVTPQTRVFLLCNPHNPLGRVWSHDELLRVADFCERHELILCSDEIHCDLVLEPGLRHVSALSLPERYHKRLVMLSAPSKTFNIAGICFTYMVVPDAELRQRIITAQGHSLPTLNVFAYAAAEAAYTSGWEWTVQLVDTLRHHRDLTHTYLSQHLPELRHWTQEATYLCWIDCSALGVDNPHEFFLKEAGVFLDNGARFGAPQCVRLNFACAPEMLLEGLSHMAAAVQKRRGAFARPSCEQR